MFLRKKNENLNLISIHHSGFFFVVIDFFDYWFVNNRYRGVLTKTILMLAFFKLKTAEKLYKNKKQNTKNAQCWFTRASGEKLRIIPRYILRVSPVGIVTERAAKKHWFDGWRQIWRLETDSMIKHWSLIEVAVKVSRTLSRAKSWTK